MALAAEVATARGAGAVVLCEDETILREFPPLRAGWARRGAAAEVPVTGGNARRVVFGALNPFTGTRLCLTAARNGGPEFRGFLRRLRGTYKRWDLLLVLDRGSCHTAKATLALAAALRTTFAWLPTACPELNPVEALWRDAKRRVSANRAHADMDAHAADFAAHVVGHTTRAALRLSGVSSGNFWLTTYDSRTSFFLGIPGTPHWEQPTGLAGLMVLRLLVVFGAVWLAARAARGSTGYAVGLGLIVVCAVGNGVDHLMWGTTVNFLALGVGAHRWPTFNVADAVDLAGVLVTAALIQRERFAERDALGLRSLRELPFALPPSFRR